MKKTILLLILALVSTGVMAQHNEFRVGYGVASTNRLLNTEHGVFGVKWKDQVNSVKSLKVNASSGAIAFGYRYQISRIRVGLAGAYEKINCEYNVGDTTGDGNYKYWTVAADMQFSYLKLPKGIVELYWGASAGLGFVTQSIDASLVDDSGNGRRNRFAYQVVPIGISAGIPWIGAYAELGFGYRGILNVGAYIRF